MSAQELLGHAITNTGTSAASAVDTNTPPSSKTTKKKPLHKIASNAVASMGALFGSAVWDDAEENILHTKEPRTQTDANDRHFPHHDLGMQGKLSQKERFFGKPWKNRSKVIPNAGNSLWAAEVRSTQY